MKFCKSNLFLKQPNHCTEMSQYLIVEINFLYIEKQKKLMKYPFRQGAQLSKPQLSVSRLWKISSVGHNCRKLFL